MSSFLTSCYSKFLCINGDGLEEIKTSCGPSIMPDNKNKKCFKMQLMVFNLSDFSKLIFMK